MMIRRTFILLAGFALTAAACGGSSDSQPTLVPTSATVAPTTAPTTTTTTAPTTTTTTSTTTTSTTTTTVPEPTGLDAIMADLVDDCRAGDDAACDVVYVISPEGSDAEAVAGDCDGRGSDDLWCTGYDPQFSAADAYGDDPFLDGLWDLCVAGVDVACDGLYNVAPWASVYEAFGFAAEIFPVWMEDCEAGDDVACDVIWTLAPPDSPEEDLGAECGGRGAPEFDGFCSGYDQNGGADDYGDDPFLDALYDLCDSGMGLACSALYFLSPAGSAYEQFGSDTAFIDETIGLNAEDQATLSALVPDWAARCEAGDDVACDLIVVFGTPSSPFFETGSTCGGRGNPDEDSGCTGYNLDTSTADAYGDDPLLDAIYDLCESGIVTACEALFFGSPLGSEYETFGEANRG